MRLTPAILFSIAVVLFLFFGTLVVNRNLEIPLHDGYFVVSYFLIVIILSALTGLKALVYFGLEKIKRPVKPQIGYWHFVFFMAGILFLFLALIMSNSLSASAPMATDYFQGNIFSSTGIGLFGTILLLLALGLFIYGLIIPAPGKEK